MSDLHNNSSFNRLSFMTTKSINVDNFNQLTSKPHKPNAIQVDSSMIEDSNGLGVIQSSSCDNFIDVQLDKSGSSEVGPYLEIEEKEIKKDFFDSYIKYEISLMNGPNSEKSILSYRRYDNFHSFYTKLKSTYPYFIYPTLSKKNVFTKIFSDNEFMQRRKKQLKFFLNYLFNHSKINSTNEFAKFIKDPEFDEEFFKEKPPQLYPESQKLSPGNLYDVINSMSSMIIKPKPSEEGRKDGDFTKAKIFYRNLLEQLVEQMKSLLIYTECIGSLGENYNHLLKDLMYFKGNKRGNNSHGHESFNHFIEIPKYLGLIHHNYYKEFQILFDDFDSFILSISGVVNAFERYEKFIVLYSNVHKAMTNSKMNSSLDISKLQEEVAKVEKSKSHFEQTLTDELNAFIKANSSRLADMINTFTLLCGSMNVNEKNRLNTYKQFIIS